MLNLNFSSLFQITHIEYVSWQPAVFSCTSHFLSFEKKLQSKKLHTIDHGFTKKTLFKRDDMNFVTGYYIWIVQYQIEMYIRHDLQISSVYAEWKSIAC